MQDCYEWLFEREKGENLTKNIKIYSVAVFLPVFGACKVMKHFYVSTNVISKL